MEQQKYAPRHFLKPTAVQVAQRREQRTSLLGHDIDHRSVWMRRLRDLIADAVSDLGVLVGYPRPFSSLASSGRQAPIMSPALPLGIGYDCHQWCPEIRWLVQYLITCGLKLEPEGLS
jgi:hypothetical protein